jgi:hypothetical protein
MEIITCREAKENRIPHYEVYVETTEELIKEATICCKEDLHPMVLLEKPFYGKIIFVDERTKLIYDAIVYDDHTSNYIYMINTDTHSINQDYIAKYEVRD